MEKFPEDSKVKNKDIKKFGLIGEVKSKFIIEKIFSFLDERKKLDIIKYCRGFRKIFSIDIEYYKKINGKYKEDGINGKGREYTLKYKHLIFNIFVNI